MVTTKRQWRQRGQRQPAPHITALQKLRRGGRHSWNLARRAAQEALCPPAGLWELASRAHLHLCLMVQGLSASRQPCGLCQPRARLCFPAALRAVAPLLMSRHLVLQLWISLAVQVRRKGRQGRLPLSHLLSKRSQSREGQHKHRAVTATSCAARQSLQVTV